MAVAPCILSAREQVESLLAIGKNISDMGSHGGEAPTKLAEAQFQVPESPESLKMAAHDKLKFRWFDLKNPQEEPSEQAVEAVETVKTELPSMSPTDKTEPPSMSPIEITSDSEPDEEPDHLLV